MTDQYVKHPRLKLGVVASLHEGPENSLINAHDLGLPTCQVVCWLSLIHI